MVRSREPNITINNDAQKKSPAYVFHKYVYFSLIIEQLSRIVYESLNIKLHMKVDLIVLSIIFKCPFSHRLFNIYLFEKIVCM